MHSPKLAKNKNIGILFGKRSDYGAKVMEKVISKKRSMSVDIAKGAAILCVVAGHCGFPLTLWINPYSFHMAFFFIIAGFFINAESGFFKFISSKITRLLVSFYAYFFACAVLALLFCEEVLPSDFFSLRVLLLDPFNRNGTFSLIHPLWFLTALFCGMFLFRLFYRAAAKLTTGISWQRQILILAIIGQFLVEAQAFLSIDSALNILFRGLIVATLLGIGYVGWKARKNWNNSTVYFIAAYVFLTLLWRFHPNYIMAQHNYNRGIIKHLFMLCSLSGFLTVFGVCKTIESIPILSKFLALCGKHSFTLMALHIAAFKLIPQDLPAGLPNILGNSWLQKTLLFTTGVVVPLAIGASFDYLRRTYINHRSQRKI